MDAKHPEKLPEKVWCLDFKKQAMQVDSAGLLDYVKEALIKGEIAMCYEMLFATTFENLLGNIPRHEVTIVEKQGVK